MPPRQPFLPIDWHSRSPQGGQAGVPGRHFDVLPGGFAPPSAAECVGLSPRPLAPDEAKQAQIVARGIQAGLDGFQTVSAPVIHLQPDEQSIEIYKTRRVIIGPQGTLLTEQFDTLLRLWGSQLYPITGDVSLGETATPGVVAIVDTGDILSGQGPALTYDVPSGFAFIVDSFGVTTYSTTAESYLIWSIIVGDTRDEGAPGAPSSNGQTILMPTTGWPYPVDKPGPIHGSNIIWPGMNGSKRISVYVTYNQNAQTADAAGYFRPTPFIVDIALHGWQRPIGPTSSRPQDLQRSTTGVNNGNCLPGGVPPAQDGGCS